MCRVSNSVHYRFRDFLSSSRSAELTCFQFSVCKCGVNRVADESTGLDCCSTAVLISKPFQHHRAGQKHGRWIGLTLTRNVGRASMSRLKDCVIVSDISGGSVAHSSD